MSYSTKEEHAIAKNLYVRERAKTIFDCYELSKKFDDEYTIKVYETIQNELKKNLKNKMSDLQSLGRLQR